MEQITTSKPKEKPIQWEGNTKKILKSFNEDLTHKIGALLLEVQKGVTPYNAKPLKGLGSGVFEIVIDYMSNTYRVVYTIRFKDKVYVLHVFQKKSKKGIKTPLKDINLIRERLKRVERLVYEKKIH